MKLKFNGLILICMAFILFAAASNTQSGWQYIITSLLLALVVMGIILPGRYLSKVNLKKYISSRMQVGKDSSIEIVITNTSNSLKRYFNIDDTPVITDQNIMSENMNLGVIGLLVKQFYSIFVFKEYTANYFLEILPGKETVKFNHLFVPSKRGIFLTGGVSISTSSPFGLFSLSKEFNSHQEIVVYPKVLEIRGGWVNRIANKSTVSELSYTYVPTSMSGTTRSLREYTPGDSPRHIHWPTSAKLNKLFTREFEIESSGFIVIVFDSSLDYENENYFELAVTTAASLLNACHQMGLVTRFVTQEGAYSNLDELKNDSWDSQLEILARIKPVLNGDICSLIDRINQALVTENARYKPTYVLVSSKYKADLSANKANIISITVSPYINKFSDFNVTNELDLRYI